MNANTNQTAGQPAKAKAPAEEPVLRTSAGIFIQAPPQNATPSGEGAQFATIEPTTNFGY